MTHLPPNRHFWWHTAKMRGGHVALFMKPDWRRKSDCFLYLVFCLLVGAENFVGAVTGEQRKEASQSCGYLMKRCRINRGTCWGYEWNWCRDTGRVFLAHLTTPSYHSGFSGLLQQYPVLEQATAYCHTPRLLSYSRGLQMGRGISALCPAFDTDLSWNTTKV